MSVPNSFVRAYLSVKGWREAYFLRCFTCDAGGGVVFDEPEIDSPFVQHPIAWMWEHAQHGHEVGINLCHSWKRCVGNPNYTPYSDVEHWFRWWWAIWSPKKNAFDLVVEDEDVS